MFDWLDSAADYVVDKAISAAQTVGNIANRVGTAGLMGLSYVLPAVAAKIGEYTIRGLQAVENISSSVVGAFTGLLDYTMELASNGKNFISNISEAVINTGKNFVQTLGNKLGLTDKGASKFFGAGDSAWSRSTGNTADFDALVKQAGGEEQFTAAISKTVIDASPVITRAPVEPRLMEATSVAKTPKDIQLEASLDELQTTLVDPSKISGIDGKIVTEIPETFDGSALFDVETGQDFTAFSTEDLVTDTDFRGVQGPVVELGPDSLFGSPEYQELQTPTIKKSLLARLDETADKLGDVASKSFKKGMKKVGEMVVDAPSMYIDQRAREEVARKVSEDMYGTPEEQFQDTLDQTRQLTAVQAGATPNPMMQYATLTGGATQTNTFDAYTTNQPVNTNAYWGSNAYQSNVYGNRMNVFGTR